jgi:hypothetical protein
MPETRVAFSPVVGQFQVSHKPAATHANHSS